MKGYRLWCPGPKSPKFIISRYVIFDESIMLNPRKENVDSDRNYEVSRQIEFENYTSRKNKEGTSVQPSEEEEHDLSEEEDAQEEQQYSITIERPRREIR